MAKDMYSGSGGGCDFTGKPSRGVDTGRKVSKGTPGSWTGKTEDNLEKAEGQK